MHMSRLVTGTKGAKEPPIKIMAYGPESATLWHLLLLYTTQLVDVEPHKIAPAQLASSSFICWLQPIAEGPINKAGPRGHGGNALPGRSIPNNIPHRRLFKP